MRLMSFAQIGTLYNSISNELEGGVTPQNQQLLLQQVSTVQTQLQGLIKSGALNNADGTGNPQETLVHAQNIADQMNFLSEQIGNFGNAQSAPQPKFINDVVRDVQDIVAGDPVLSSLAHQNNSNGFEQVSNLLTPPTPFADSGQQSATLLQFIANSNSLATRAQALAGADPNGAQAADIQTLEQDIRTFSTNADAYSNMQGGVFSARFNNEFTSNGVQGTASRELVTGLETGNAALVKGAAEVLTANANDVSTNMSGGTGQNFTPAMNGGIPLEIKDVHNAGIVFNDAVTKLIGGVASTNQASVVADLQATQSGLQNVIDQGGMSATELKHLQKVVSLLGQETTAVASIDTAPGSTTPVSGVNGQINNLQSQILNIVNHDTALASAAVGADGTTGFAALPPANTGTLPHTPTEMAVDTHTPHIPFVHDFHHVWG